MPLQWLTARLRASRTRSRPAIRSTLWLAILLFMAPFVSAMKTSRIAELRQEARDLFYHGYDNYMTHAFPEDELRPVSCVPLSRDSKDDRNFELNDVLGNYSLTLVDTLSTLAILASAPEDEAEAGGKALGAFQDGVKAFVEAYGDGSSGPKGQGYRHRGFDIDSKVQVFETVIRGVGGLLSAHLFAIGELPMKNYNPIKRHVSKQGAVYDDRSYGDFLDWPNGFSYHGQLLWLAYDLAERLMPAFYTKTGMPYPRVNLRDGIPFYQNSPLEDNPPKGGYEPDRPETTETCSAGAGSLVLEFTVLSRLTGDARFEQVAKRAFWEVWNRRSDIGLIGAGIDAENGHWIGPFAGVGAGTDSFFEYALKTHILTSGLALPNVTQQDTRISDVFLNPNTIFNPLTTDENSPDAFLWVWKKAHAAVKRHIYSSTHHPHYVNVHLQTGSPQIYWIDSLGAYFPGLLTLAGELEEATEINLLYTALWTRYAALPERWSVRDGNIEGGLGWWPGRPEFIESNYYLYQATKDPWYLHVGEMVLKDIQRRCWTQCGWSGLQDVRTGEKNDRMQSFFLGETAKYLYLLFDPDHPLNKLDAPVVFSTEGHPLIVPRSPVDSEDLHLNKKDRILRYANNSKTTLANPYTYDINGETCPRPPSLLPFGKSPTAARPDVFHAASLTGLHNIGNDRHHPLVCDRNNESVPMQVDAKQFEANHTIYPWTLPTSLIPHDASCAVLPLRPAFSIQFPSTPLPNVPNDLNHLLGTRSNLARVQGQGMLVNNLSGVKFEMVEEDADYVSKQWRITSVGHMNLGRDEVVYVKRETMGNIMDPSFSRIKDPAHMDLILQLDEVVLEPTPKPQPPVDGNQTDDASEGKTKETNERDAEEKVPEEVTGDWLSSLLEHVTSALRDPMATLLPQHLLSNYNIPSIPQYKSIVMPAIAPSGPGAAALPAVPDAPWPPADLKAGINKLSWESIYFADPPQACDEPLPKEAVTDHQIVVIRRGDCMFSRKLEMLPIYTPSKRGLKLVIIVDYEERKDGEIIQPRLGELQLTPGGMRRVHEVPMVAVSGGQETWDALKRARGVGLRRRYWVESAGLKIGNLIVI